MVRLVIMGMEKIDARDSTKEKSVKILLVTQESIKVEIFKIIKRGVNSEDTEV